jgi:polysaccharide export outer membrane protein
MSRVLVLLFSALGLAATAGAQAPAPRVSPPIGYVIGTDDVLSIMFWKEQELSAEVTVRPDGMISLPLLHEIPAAGLTPEELRVKLAEAAGRYIEEPNATVVVKEIRSRKVFITGNVTRPAAYPLNGEMDVLQLIALAGGLLEYADGKHIVVLRKTGERRESFHFNYNDVIKRGNTRHNLLLKPGDTVVVP